MADSMIEIDLDTAGVAAAGVDLQSLEGDIQAEIEKLASQLEQPVPQPARRAPPESAQGIDQVVHWFLQLAAEPSMAKVYAQTLIFSINEIATAARNSKNTLNAHQESFVVRVKAFGKDILLPTTTAVIQAAMEDIHGK